MMSISAMHATVDSRIFTFPNISGCPLGLTDLPAQGKPASVLKPQLGGFVPHTLRLSFS